MPTTRHQKAGRGRPAARNERDVKAALLVAARELFLRYGYREVSARQVADAAGVNPAMVQYYFRSKQGLYAAMLAEAVGPLTSRIESMVAGSYGDELDLGGLLEAYMRTVAAHPWVPGLLMREVLAPDGAFRERFIADFAGRFAPKVARIIERAIESGQARADLDPRLTLVSFLSLGLWPFLAMPVVSRVLGLEKSPAAMDRLIQHTVRLFEAGTAPGETRS